MAAEPIGLAELARDFQAWLDERRDAHARFKSLPREFGDRVDVVNELQRELFDAGWSHYGWPEAQGGRGGTVLHRAVVCDTLERNGFPPRQHFEHLDILPPALVRFGRPELVEELFLPTIRGDVLWCQGFSEPTAGSDLAALKTKATRVDGGYQIDGHKIWTSWAKWATHCMFLARTGTVEDRHRGLSAFVVEIDAPGITVGPIRQANGTEELAEVFFDGVFVPDAQRVGDEGQGWAVAMHILAGERGSYTWLRQSELLARLEILSADPRARENAGLLGESLCRLHALRCRSRAVMEILARGEEPGPESSVTKVLVIDTEQHHYDVARRVLSPDIDLGLGDHAEDWQEHYLYSRASSIYGGSRQIQLNVIGRLLLSDGRRTQAPPKTDADAELEAVRHSVSEAIEKSADTREALAGLDWFAFAAAPGDAFGRTAFAAWFEAQGRSLATSPALAAIACADVAEQIGCEPALLAFARAPQTPDAVALACGFDEKTRVVVALARDGSLRATDASEATVAASGALDAKLLHGLRVPEGRALQTGADTRERARTLARIGASFEILGAARALLVKSAAHTAEREQFGQPIGRFQAIQHLLAESLVDVAALEEMCRSALEEWSAGGGRALSMTAKAWAGRAGRDVAQRALQCFGGIGFTDEHDHHLYSRRIHTLDAFFDGYYALHRRLGEELVESGRAPRGIEAWRGAGAH